MTSYPNTRLRCGHPLALVVLALLPGITALPLHAAGIVRATEVDAEISCLGVRRDGGVCQEWRFVADDSLRIRMEGYEDGGTTHLYRRHGPGSYTLIARIQPVFEGPGKPRCFDWAAQSDITDIAIVGGRGGLRLFATLDYEVELDDGPDAEPERRTRIPLVLFKGDGRQPQSKVCGGPMRSMSLDALERNERAAGLSSGRGGSAP